jgi:RNA polymerase sigma-70 factor (ECF subfamily)
LTRLVISACSRKKRGLRNNPRIHVSLEDIGSRREVRPHTRPQAESTAAIKEAFEHIETALNQLNATDRAVLLLRDGKELSTAETARVLDLTVPAVKSRLHRARKSIRQLVESAFDASEAA